MTENKAVQAAPTQAPATKQLTPSERFQNEVQRQFGNAGGKLELTEFQRRLIQNYFITLDRALKAAEVKRTGTKEDKREPLAYSWPNINVEKFAIDVVTYSSVGLDPVQNNHINIVPYKNKATNKYDITFIVGYKGIELKAKKYGIDVPDAVIVEIVYSNDEYVEYKRSRTNKVENYDFNITKPFDRGELVGGFYFHEYYKTPEKNKLVSFSKADIEKRKPAYASAEFWGGEKDNWVWDADKQKNVKKGTTPVDGWYDEMAYKTIYRAAYNSITIDSELIDAHYVAMLDNDQSRFEETLQADIKANANQKEIGFEEPLTEAVVTTAEKPATEEKPEFE